MQIKLNMKRASQRIINDKASTFTPIIGNVILALIIGSVFYGTPATTSGFTAKGATLFFAILINALTAISEINSLYEQRPIVEKHKSYAFYHPATEAAAGIVLSLPLKFMEATGMLTTVVHVVHPHPLVDHVADCAILQCLTLSSIFSPD